MTFECDSIVANNIVKFPNPSLTYTIEGVQSNKWVGRIILVQISTGLRIQGKILNVTSEWVDTDQGAFRVDNIVMAKWVSDEEAQITRGGPLGQFGSLSGRSSNQFTR